MAKESQVRAQLVFSYDSARLKHPPKTATELAKYSKNPGQFTFPQPPDFIGMSFLKQILIELTGGDPALYKPVSESNFASITTPLWRWLDEAKPNLWRSGNAYPTGISSSPASCDGEIDIAIAFNPADASAAIARGELPSTIRTYIHDGGTLANVHFLAIPFNAAAPEAAKVVNSCCHPKRR